MRDLILDTMRSLRAHSLRFGLTSLGIAWGAFLLTFLSASVAGLNEHYAREMAEAGPKMVVVRPGSVFKNRVGERGARNVELETGDVSSIEALQDVEVSAPNIAAWSQIVRAGRRTKLVNVHGVSEKSAALRNLVAAEGRFLTRLDVERNARVAFIGPEVGAKLFGRAPALGRSLQIEGMSFRVVGVATAKKDQLIGINGWDDWTIFIPFTTMQRWFVRTDKVQKILFAPYELEKSGETIRDTRTLLGLRHDFPPDLDTALHFFDVQEILAIIRTILVGLTIFEISAGVITLLVGAIGVMNIMLVVVAERTNEIGLRKAIGASRRAIFVQFLAEAVAVCGAAGILGAFLGVGACQLMARLAPPDGPLSSPPILDPATAILLSGSLIAMGIVAGVAPAVRAARIPPAEALRA